jgi:outer membrane protein assembly factor BamB
VSAAEDVKNLWYGRSNSPLIVDDLLVIAGGGPRDGRQYSLVAYDRRTGDPVWKGGDRQPAYCSPTLATLAKTPQILIVNENNVSSHDSATGEELWNYDWPGSSSGFANVSQAVPAGDDRVFLSNGYNNGAALLQITYSGGDGWRAEKVWHRSTAMRTKFTNVVILDQSVYGLSDGILECLSLETGRRRWKRRAGRYGHGQILRVGTALLVQAEQGDSSNCRRTICWREDASPPCTEKRGTTSACSATCSWYAMGWKRPALNYQWRSRPP